MAAARKAPPIPGLGGRVLHLSDFDPGGVAVIDLQPRSGGKKSWPPLVRTVALACVLVAGIAHAATPVDPRRLPPAATSPVEFTRDIKPIFEESCLRCHGPEKPKSRFRLDNREDALKGGENGVAIIPGDSAKSRLIHLVAGLVEDTEMPPTGKAKPLTATQIGLLRAWIDQGATWEQATPPPRMEVLMAPPPSAFQSRAGRRIR